MLGVLVAVLGLAERPAGFRNVDLVGARISASSSSYLKRNRWLSRSAGLGFIGEKHVETGLMGGILSMRRSLNRRDWKKINSTLAETLCRWLVDIFAQRETFFSRPRSWSRPDIIIHTPKASLHHTNKIVSYIRPRHSLRIPIFRMNSQNSTVDALTADKNKYIGGRSPYQSISKFNAFLRLFPGQNPAGK